MTLEIASARFWESDQSHVLANPRDAAAVAEAGLIRPWLQQQSGLSGHLLFATSGSGGARKWVALSRPALLASAAMVNRHLEADAKDHWLLALPHFHVGGMGVGARCYHAGSKMQVMQGKWDPRTFHDHAVAQAATLSSLVPTQLFDLVQYGLRAPDTLRAVLIGGGQLSDAIYQRAIELGWPVQETYGMTEASSQIATSRPGCRALEILPGWETRLSQQRCLEIRGEALLSAYVLCEGDACRIHDPKEDGWFDTGDMVEPGEGGIVVKGRAERCVKVSGELVNLCRVEQDLARVAAELEFGDFEPVVVALADARRGNRLVLCSEKPMAAEQLLAVYHRACAPMARVDEVHVLEAIPRSPLGKVIYPALAEALARHPARGRQ